MRAGDTETRKKIVRVLEENGPLTFGQIARLCVIRYKSAVRIGDGMKDLNCCVFIGRLDDVPPEYWRVIPETREPDKRKMLEDLRAGREIPGALLAQGSSLRIR